MINKYYSITYRTNIHQKMNILYDINIPQTAYFPYIFGEKFLKSLQPQSTIESTHYVSSPPKAPSLFSIMKNAFYNIYYYILPHKNHTVNAIHNIIAEYKAYKEPSIFSQEFYTAFYKKLKEVGISDKSNANYHLDSGTFEGFNIKLDVSGIFTSNEHQIWSIEQQSMINTIINIHKKGIYFGFAAELPPYEKLPCECFSSVSTNILKRSPSSGLLLLRHHIKHILPALHDIIYVEEMQIYINTDTKTIAGVNWTLEYVNTNEDEKFIYVGNCLLYNKTYSITLDAIPESINIRIAK